MINRVNSNGQRNVVEASSSWALHCDALVRPAEPLEAHADHEQEVDGAGDRDPGERGSPRVIADPLPGIAHDEVDRQRHPPENGPKGVSHALIDEREVVLAQTLVVVQGDPKLEEEYRIMNSRPATIEMPETAPLTSVIFAPSIHVTAPPISGRNTCAVMPRQS